MTFIFKISERALRVIHGLHNRPSEQLIHICISIDKYRNNMTGNKSKKNTLYGVLESSSIIIYNEI